MGAIQSKINNILGSFGAVAYATNRYNEGISKAEDKKLADVTAKNEALEAQAKAEGEEIMRNAFAENEKQKAHEEEMRKAKAEARRLTRNQALQVAMQEIKSKFKQKIDLKSRMNFSQRTLNKLREKSPTFRDIQKKEVKGK